MSKQLALSAAFSVFMMAAYVVLGTSAVRQPMPLDGAPAAASPFEVSMPALPQPSALLAVLR